MKIVPVNQAFWGMNDAQRKRKHNEYVAWFNGKKQTQEGMQELIEGKRFNNWARVFPHKDGKYDPKDFQPDGYGLFCMNTADPAKLIRVASKKKAANDRFLSEAFKHVGGNPDAPLLDPKYLERAKVTKELKERLTVYTGNKDAASDLLFLTKKESDAQGKDFLAVAKAEIETMKAHKPDLTPASIVPPPPPLSKTKQLGRWMNAHAYQLMGVFFAGVFIALAASLGGS